MTCVIMRFVHNNQKGVLAMEQEVEIEFKNLLTPDEFFESRTICPLRKNLLSLRSTTISIPPLSH